MSPQRRRFIIASLIIAMIVVGGVLYWRSRPVPAAALAADISRGQIAAPAAEIFSEPSKTSVFGPVVLKIDSPRKVNSLAQIQPGDYLVIGDNQYIVGQTELAASQAHEYGRPSDYYLLPMPATLYRMRADGDFDRVKRDSVSIVRLTSTSPMK
jgi:hypothetical protein